MQYFLFDYTITYHLLETYQSFLKRLLSYLIKLQFSADVDHI